MIAKEISYEQAVQEAKLYKLKEGLSLLRNPKVPSYLTAARNHMEAVQLLLDYIGDAEVKKLYHGLNRRY